MRKLGKSWKFVINLSELRKIQGNVYSNIFVQF